MPFDVFISYAEEDKSVADAICSFLEAKRIRCWIAPRDILPGISYGSSIIDAINSVKLMVLVFSSSSNQSKFVINEVERGVSKGLTIIPFRIEDIALSKDMEFFVSRQHWLDALSPPMEQHIGRLIDVVQSILNNRPKSGNIDQMAQPADTFPTQPFGNHMAQSAGQPMQGRLYGKKIKAWIAVAVAVLLVVGGYLIFSLPSDSGGNDNTYAGDTSGSSHGLSDLLKTESGTSPTDTPDAKATPSAEQSSNPPDVSTPDPTDSPEPAPTPEATGDAPAGTSQPGSNAVLGYVDGITYTNDFFGFTVDLPDGWFIANHEQLIQIMQITGVQSASDAELDPLQQSLVPLLASASVNPLLNFTADNSNIIALAENISAVKSFIPDIKSYLDVAMQQVELQGANTTFGDIETLTVDGREVGKVTGITDQDGAQFTQVMYSFLADDYVITLTLTCFTEDDLTLLEDAMKTLKFK